MFSKFFTGVALAATLTLPLSLAMPLEPRGAGSITATSITSIDPTTSSCDNSPAAGECRTATEAAPCISIAFENFGVSSFGAQAALLSLMLYETAGFKYDRNHYPAPGRPGQGTRNMQMPEYNLKYATWLATNCANCGISSSQVEEAKGKGVDAVLELVNGDQWGFASAAWFLSTQCNASVMQGLSAGTEQGWETYLTSCVGTTVTEDRTAIWRKAIALGNW